MPEGEDFQEGPKKDIEVICATIRNLEKGDSVEIIGYADNEGFAHSLGSVLSTIPMPGKGASVTINVSSGRLRGKVVTYKAEKIHDITLY